MSRSPTAWIVERLLLVSGACPVQTFLDGLNGQNRIDAVALLKLLAEHGNTLRPPTSKLLEQGVFELRSHQVRIFYMFRPGRRVILLDGIIKKQDAIPKATMKLLRQYRRLVKAMEEASG